MLQSFTNNDIIDILMDENINYREIVISLAKKNPEILYAIVKGDNKDNFDHYIYNNFKNNKVGGVREIRAKYDTDLKTSVEMFNKIMEKYDE
jgi:hypothetical protein